MSYDRLNENILEEFNGMSVLLCTVRKNDPLIALLGDKMDLQVLNYKYNLPFGLDYNSPETLGMDRLAAAAGARSLFPDGPLLVVDVGSCMTYDFISDENVYMGGVISPGIDMRLRAMHEFTSALPEVTLGNDYQSVTIGKTTVECLLAGSVEATAHELKGFIHSLSHHKELQIVITGGRREYLAKRIENNTFVAPNLVLIGLNKIRLLNAH